MKIFFHVPRENWFVDRMGVEFMKKSRHDVVSEMSFQNVLDCDVVWLAASWCWKQIPIELLQRKKVLCTIHHEVPQKFDHARELEFKRRDEIVDAYHVPCEQTERFIEKYTKKPIHRVGYWCNDLLWPILNNLQCKLKNKIPTDKFVIGSFQRDTEGSDQTKPKLEKGPDLFCDYVAGFKKNGKDVHVLLSGWRRQYVMQRLSDMEIPYSYFELPALETLSELYSACDLYVVSSRYEGGPQAILECAQKKVPLVSTNVGMAPDIVHQNCIISFDVDGNAKQIVPDEQSVLFAFENVQKYLLLNHVKSYDDLLESM